MENKKKPVFWMKLKENLLFMQICCNLAPEEMKEREGEVIGLIPPAGTQLGWSVKWDVDPVQCAEMEGYWHYMLEC